jgi:hypothetical protein
MSGEAGGRHCRVTAPYDEASQTNTARLISFQTLMLRRDCLAGFLYRKKADRMSKIPLRLISPSPIEHFSVRTV